MYRADLEGVLGFVRPVALKVLNPDMEGLAEVAQRLRDEARLLGLVRHRSIVQVDALALFEGRWGLIMEYVAGVDLRELLEEGPVPVGVAVDIAEEIAAALHAGYAALSPSGRPIGLLHRDMKPANIRLTPAGEVKLCDFGVARASFDTRECQTDRLCFGSPAYMAPERFDYYELHAGDVYGVGALLYELIIGAPVGETSMDLRNHQELLRLARKELRRTVGDSDLVELILSALAFDPNRRPTARELQQSLRALRCMFDDPWVSDWAAIFVARRVEGRREDSGEWTGSLLVEDPLWNEGDPLAATGPPALARSARPKSPFRAWTLLGASATVGLGTAAALCTLFLTAF
jgi:serine/threonine-protein kinase